MHLLILGPRRRTRRALLAAALPAVLAAAALPSPAHAATAEVINASPNGVLGYSAADGEVNNVRVSVSGTKLVISDAAPITARNGCTLNALGDAECPIGVDSISMVLRNGNDVAQYAAPHPGVVVGEEGDDTFFGGVRQAVPGRAIQPVTFLGREGTDTVSYRFADRGVRVDTADGQQEDGRPGDRENVNTDIERIEGSNFADVLFGSSANNTIIGLNGDDEIGGGDGNDVILENVGPNGADSVNGGGGADRVLYSGRTSDVFVSLDGIANDGQSGERDDVRPNVENITGSPSGNDVLIGNSLANDLQGFGGDDALRGGGGNDTLSGGAGHNGLFGDAGSDVINARNGQTDTIDCGADRDTANRDSVEGSVVGCESIQVDHGGELVELGGALVVSVAADDVPRQLEVVRLMPGLPSAIARYDSLTADEINSRLTELSQIDLAKVGSYERRHQNRTTVLSRISTLRGDEPWAGYDELTAAEVQAVLSEGDDEG